MKKSSDVYLRPATANDREFVYSVLKEASKEHVIETWRWWDEAGQRENFDANFAPAHVRIIRTGGRDAGFYALQNFGKELFLSELNLLPEFQRRGIGSFVMRGILEDAKKRGLPVRLHVLKVNSASLFYERLGFSVTGGTESHYHMEWVAQSMDDN